MAVKKGQLTLKQQRFVEAYLGEAAGNATEAARLAGYKNGGESSLRAMAAENLAKPAIQKAIQKVKSVETKRAIMSREQRLEVLAEIVENAKNPFARMKAIEIMCRMNGEFLERRVVEARVEVNDVRERVRELIERGTIIESVRKIEQELADA